MGEKVLSLHEPNYFKGKFNSEKEVIEGLTALRLKNVGCTESHESHGNECFRSVKTQIKKEIEKLEVLEELRKLLSGTSQIRDASNVRIVLSKRFPVFKDDIQQAAGDAYLSILECMANVKTLCSLHLKRRRCCCECGRVETRDDTDEWCMMLNYQGTKRSLQEVVNEYCISDSAVLCDCICKRNIS